MKLLDIINLFKQTADVELQAKLEQESIARRARNDARMAKIKADMGELYILHPNHKKSRLDEPRPV